MNNIWNATFTFLLFVSFGAASGAASVSAPAAVESKAEKTMEVQSGKVEFLAIGKPSFLKVRGVGTAPKGTLKLKGTTASGEFSFDLSSLDTEIALRNEHMKEKYLEVSKFPTATVRFQNVEAKDGVKTTVGADLELHGVKKQISMDAVLLPQEADGTTKKATSTFKIKLTDFNIAIPSHLGIAIADEVTVTVESVLK